MRPRFCYFNIFQWYQRDDHFRKAIPWSFGQTERVNETLWKIHLAWSDSQFGQTGKASRVTWDATACGFKRTLEGQAPSGKTYLCEVWSQWRNRSPLFLKPILWTGFDMSLLVMYWFANQNSRYLPTRTTRIQHQPCHASLTIQSSTVPMSHEGLSRAEKFRPP